MMMMMMRKMRRRWWINNIQARWGLPYAYRLGKGLMGGGGGVGHNEPTMRSSQQCRVRWHWFPERKKALNYFSCILRKMVDSLTDGSRQKGRAIWGQSSEAKQFSIKGFKAPMHLSCSLFITQRWKSSFLRGSNLQGYCCMYDDAANSHPATLVAVFLRVRARVCNYNVEALPPIEN